MLDIPEYAKAAFRKDGAHKIIRIHFPNGEHEDLVNKDIVSESLRFTESACSEKNLKFGLCEASELRFSTIECGNIKGCEIEAAIEVWHDAASDPATGEEAEEGYYSVPFGRFTVDSCRRNADGFKRDVVAYGQNITADTQWSSFELWRRALPVMNNVPYTSDLARLATAQTNSEQWLTLVKSVKGKIERSTLTKDYYQVPGYESLGDVKIELYYTSALLDINTPGLTDDFIRINFVKGSGYDEAVRILADTGLRVNGKTDPELFVNYVLGYDGPTTHNAFESGDILQPKLAVNNIYYDGDYFNPGTQYVTTIPFDRLVDMNIGGLEKWTGVANSFCQVVSIVAPCKMCLVDESGSEVKSFELAQLTDNFYEIFEYDKPTSIPLSIARKKSGTEKIEGKSHALYSVAAADNTMLTDGVLNAYMELLGMFGRATRDGGYKFVPINDTFGLYPSESRYPSETLYPREAHGTAYRSTYKSLWYDDYEVKPFGTVVCSYVDENGEAQTLVYQFDAEAENTYYMTDNYVLQNTQMSEADLKAFLDEYFIPNISNIKYYPAEIEMRGMPYLEAGDTLQVITEEGGFETIILQRTLSGVQSLTDSVDATGDEVNNAADYYDYGTEEES